MSLRMRKRAELYMQAALETRHAYYALLMSGLWIYRINLYYLSAIRTVT